MIVLAPDKFKGTLSSAEAAAAMKAGLRKAGIEGPYCCVAMADGGEGTAEALGGVSLRDGSYMLPGGERLVLSCEHAGSAVADKAVTERSSAGLGRIVRRLIDETEAHIYMGIGGTMTCDGGAGFLQALGWKFRRGDGSVIMEDITPEILAQGIAAVEAPEFDSKRITGLCDVSCPLLPQAGDELSALDFIVQKGAKTPEQQALIRRGLEALSGALGRCGAPFGGAGGGLGYALGVALDAEMKYGAEFVLEQNAPKLRDATLILTGEGKIDAQTRGGKSVSAVMRYAREHGVACAAFGGRVEPGMANPPVINEVIQPSSPVPATAEEAAAQLAEAVERWGERRLNALLFDFFGCIGVKN